MKMEITERALKNIELRLNDIVRLENSIRELNSMTLTAAAHIDIHVSMSHLLYTQTQLIFTARYA